MKASALSLKNNYILIGILIPVCLGLVALSNIFGVIVSILVIGVIFFISFFYVSYRYPRYNIVILLAVNYFLCLLIKVLDLYDVPFGIVIEAFCSVMLIALMLNGRISGLKTLPGILMVIWLCYQLIELANPNATSRVAGFSAIRIMVPFMSCFFVMYSSVETKRDITIFLTGWLFLGLLAALYALFQEFVMVPSYDYDYATMDEANYRLLFTWGRMRKFSFFFNPSEFGMLMSLTGVSGFVVSFFTREKKLKILAAATAFFCMWALLYTGSRTAMVILPIGLLMVVAAITLNRKILIAVGVVGLLGTAIMLRPQSGAVYIMSTAFSGADDPSMNLRLENRNMVRSYILDNPIGYGLGATGYLGKKYSPGTFIGTFDTDSEYVRVAVELGWIGLLLWCTILCLFFSHGVMLYFETEDQEWRTFLVVALTCVFMLIVAMYAQEVFITFLLPSMLACMVGIIAKIGAKFSRRVVEEEVE